MKYREEYDKQLLVKVNLAPFGDGIDVDRLIVLNYKLRLVDCPAPVDFVEAAMHVLENKEEPVAVLFIKLNE